MNFWVAIVMTLVSFLVGMTLMGFLLLYLIFGRED